MKILIDLNHPAHIHIFKNIIKQCRQRGHDVLVTASSKDILLNLLDDYAVDYVKLSCYGKTMRQKICNMMKIDFQMFKIVKKYNPDVLIGVASFRAAHSAFLLRKKCFIFDDTENRKEIMLYYTFATKVFTPSCFDLELGKKQFRYNSYHELAYLHPDNFRPDPESLKKAGISENEKFFIVRFVSWEANHDIGQRGFSQEGKKEVIRKLEKHGKVIVSCEGEPPHDSKNIDLLIPADKMHDLLYYAAMYVGEGASMASEAAVLGTPSLYVNTITAGTLREQEDKYGLLCSCRNENKVFSKIDEFLEITDLKPKWREKRDLMLKDKKDLSAFIQTVLEADKIIV